MGQMAAKEGDKIVATDTHVVMVPAPNGAVPTPFSDLQFNGPLDANLIQSVRIMGRPAAVVGSSAKNQPIHDPNPHGPSFQRPPTNEGQIELGSTTVRIGGRAAARDGDIAITCNDPVDAPVGKVVVSRSTVFIG